MTVQFKTSLRFYTQSDRRPHTQSVSLYSGGGPSTLEVVPLQWRWSLYIGGGPSTVEVVPLQWRWSLCVHMLCDVLSPE